MLASASGYGRDGSRTSRGLLLAEALHALGSHVGRLWVCVRVGVGREFAVVSSSVVGLLGSERRNCVCSTDHRLALATSMFLAMR
jgi:hypothetical protein